MASLTISPHNQLAPAILGDACLLRNEVTPDSPLLLQPQDLSRPYTDPVAPLWRSDSKTGWCRAGIMLGTAFLTTAFSYQMALFLAAGGMTGLEWLALALYTLTFMWIAFALVTAVVGAALLFGGKDDPPGAVPRPLRVALLVLAYNDAPWRVFGNATAMLNSLAEAHSSHSYDFFVLSDTDDAELASKEVAAFYASQALLKPEAPLYYRRRARNIGRKVGNISDWLCRWGGAYDAFLVLDADSIMSEVAIQTLADELARDDSLGLVQSVPLIIGARTLFASVQQFSSAALGPIVTASSAIWMGAEANYYGHNAILRTSAFAASASLPKLPGKPPFGGDILSHDFVEAAMLRRAGWAVRLIQLRDGSYEETPPSVIDHALRDRRWCQGNLQHLRVLTAAGFHPVSRFHLLQGIMAYMVSPLWVLFLLCGVAAHLEGKVPAGDGMLLTPGQSPEAGRGLAVLAGTLLILLAPKVMGVARLAVMNEADHYGGRVKLLGSALLEIMLSSIIAPILMVQQAIAVLRVFSGIDGGWRPQRCEVAERTWFTYVQFHVAETALGLVLVTCIIAGWLTWWLWPVAASLFLAALISRLTSASMVNMPEQVRPVATPEDAGRLTIIARSLAHAQRIAEAAEAAAPPVEMLRAAE